MAVLEQNNKQRIISRSILAAILTGSMVFAIYLLTAATGLSTESGVQIGSIGPVELFELYKVPSELGGYNAGLNFYGGIVWYIVGWLWIGIVISAYRIKKSAKAGKRAYNE